MRAYPVLLRVSEIGCLALCLMWCGEMLVQRGAAVGLSTPTLALGGFFVLGNESFRLL